MAFSCSIAHANLVDGITLHANATNLMTARFGGIQKPILAEYCHDSGLVILDTITKEFTTHKGPLGSGSNKPTFFMRNLFTYALSPAARCVTPFDFFSVEVELEEDDDGGEFGVDDGFFILGADSNGIDPLTEDVTLEIGSFSVTIPAGSFEEDDDEFEFEGVIDGVELEVTIEGHRGATFSVEASGEGADLAGTVNPVTVVLTIGDDRGEVVVEAEIDDG